MNAILSAEPRYRWLRLTGAVLVAWVVVLVPFAMYAPAREPAGIAIGQALICGVLLGLGRQGIDVLVLRLLGVSVALLVGSAISQHTGSLCGGPQQCAQLIVLGVVGFGLFGVVVLGIVAVPTAMIWNKGVTALRPEIRWPVPKTWWQWLVLALGVFIGIPLVGVLLLGIPWPG